MNTQNKNAISMGYVHVIADFVEARGGNKDVFLKKAGIDQKSLSHFFSFISLSQYERLLQEAKAITNDAAMGLYIGQGMKFGSHGTFAYAALSFPTAWEALKVGQKFSKLCNRIVDIHMEEQDEYNAIRIETDYFTGERYQTIIEIVMGTFCEIFKLKFDGNISLIEIDLRYKQPQYAELYDRFLSPNIQFSTGSNTIRIPKALANKRLALADTIVAAKFERECDELFAKMAEPKDIAEQVREVLFLPNGKILSLDALAEKFYMSSRTLRRRLQACGTSYNKIVEEERLAKARQYLINTAMSIGEISRLLNYEDQNSFSHAFKILVGIPPTKFRHLSQNN